MFYYVLIFFCLCYHMRRLPVFHALILSFIIFPALYYIVSLLGAKVIYNEQLDVISFFIFLLFLIYKATSWIKGVATYEKDLFVDLFILFVSLIGFIFLYHKTFLLPGHDPIAPPTLAKIIYNSRCLPKTLAPLSDRPLDYPPGYSIFLSIFYNFQNPFLVLWIYKYINICVVSFTPAIWAFYYKKIYHIDFAKSYFVLLSFYYGFFFFDRTLPLALAFAGKNAALYSYMLFPAVFFMFLKNNKSIIDKIIIILAALGMILIHYTFIFVFSLLLFFHVLVDLKREKGAILKYLTMFFCAGILFIPFYLGLKNSSFISLYMPDASLIKAVEFFKSACSTNKTPASNYFFWIFFGLGIPWDYKKFVLLFFFMMPALHYLINTLVRRRPLPLSQECIMRIIFSTSFSIIGALIILCGLLVKPTFPIEYVRWFVFNYFAILGSVFLLYLSDLIGKMGKRIGRAVILSIFIIIPIFHFYYVKDFQKIYAMINLQKVSYEEMKNAQGILEGLSNGKACYLITESDEAKDTWFDLTMQKYKPLDYYYVISDCSILNGSWMTLPLENSRSLFNLPSQSFFASTHFEPIYFIGKEETLNRYLGEIENISANKLEIEMGGNSIYKIIYNHTQEPGARISQPPPVKALTLGHT